MKIRVLDVTEASDFYQIGYLHGSAAGTEIKECVEKVKALFGSSVDELKRMFREETTYLDNIRTYLPNVYREFCGMCDGAGIEQEELLLLNCLDECYLLLNERNLIGHCTSFGIKQADDEVIIGQNLDFMKLFDGYQIQIRMKSPKNGMRMETVGFAGQIFGIGMNERGIALVSTTLLNGAYHKNRGIPNTFVQKALLYTETLQEAVEILKGCPVSTATSWTIAAPCEVMCLETTANRVAIFPEEAVYAHTNHVLCTDDVIAVPNVSDENGLILHNGKSWELTLERLEVMKKTVYQYPAINELCSKLSEPPIQRTDTSRTLLSVVMSLKEKEGYLWYRGSDAAQEYTQIKMNWRKANERTNE